MNDNISKNEILYQIIAYFPFENLPTNRANRRTMLLFMLLFNQ